MNPCNTSLIHRRQIAEMRLPRTGVNAPVMRKFFAFILVLFLVSGSNIGSAQDTGVVGEPPIVEKHPIETASSFEDAEARNLSIDQTDTDPEGAKIEGGQKLALGLEIGDLATWFSGFLTAAVFLFTLHAWRFERLRARELEVKETETEQLREAKSVSAWLEKSKPTLRTRTGTTDSFLPDGAWALIIENGASFSLLSWSIYVTTSNPRTEIATNSQSFGPIGPRGGTLILPISELPVDSMPTVKIEFSFDDDHGQAWTRSQNGLTKV